MPSLLSLCGPEAPLNSHFKKRPFMSMGHPGYLKVEEITKSSLPRLFDRYGFGLSVWLVSVSDDLTKTMHIFLQFTKCVSDTALFLVPKKINGMPSFFISDHRYRFYNSTSKKTQQTVKKKKK